MSLESILSRIFKEADIQKKRIIQEATLEAERIVKEAQQEAQVLYQNIIARAKASYESEKQRRIVNARLEHRKSLLAVKQESIESVFKKLKSTLKGDKFKKQQVCQDKIKEVSEDIDFYLNNTRLEYETEIAKILFG